jgi:hypothetical protein
VKHVLLVFSLVLSSSAAGPPAQNRGVLPREALVTDSAGLLAAIRAPGVYQLAPGTYTGNFTLAVGGVTIVGAALPPMRVQANATSDYRIIPADGTRPTLSITASNVSVSGVSIGQGQPERAVVVVGSSTAADPLSQPDGVTLDRVEVIAGTAGGRRGIEAHTRTFTLSRSRVIGFVHRGADSQALLAINGPGPYHLIDNELEGSGENVMFGGGSIRSAEMVPGGIVVRGNLLRKPQEWRAKRGSVKNAFECKACNGALIEDNVFDGCWRDAQAGHLIVLTPRNQNGDSPWTVVQDVIIRRNRSIRHTDGYAVNILGSDDNHTSGRTARITIEGNLFEDSVKGFLINRGVDGLTIARNTLPAVRWNLITFTGTDTLKTPLTFTGNVARSGEYGVSGDRASVGMPALLAYTSSLTWNSNVIEKTAQRRIRWPDGTTLLAPGALAPQLDRSFRYPGAGW